jgi:hypothetical protein
MININRKQIQQDFEDWLDTPEGAQFGQPGPVLSTILFLGAIVVGVFLIFTIIGVVHGFKSLKWALTLTPFRNHSLCEGAKPVIAHGIIVNSALTSGEETEGPGMVLASFEDETDLPPLYLHKLAGKIAKVYSDGPETPNEKILYPLVEDDDDKGDKAQPVPEPYAKGRRIFTDSTMLDITKSIAGPSGSVLFAFVGKPDTSDYKEVSLHQIPWTVIGRAVKRDGTIPKDYPSRDPRSPVERKAQRNKVERNRMIKLLSVSVGILLLPVVLLPAMRMIGSSDVDEVRSHPIVMEQIGGIESYSFSVFGSLNAGKNTTVYSVEGPNGEGDLMIWDPLLGGKTVRLRTKDGEWELTD